MLARLPRSILHAVSNREVPQAGINQLQKHYVLLENRTALAAAAALARSYGFCTEIADDLVEAKIEEGCSQLLSRLAALRAAATRNENAVCLISGGEFLCPVKGTGVGGRNAETVLRCAIEIDQQSRQPGEVERVVVLSAGTDGIDGNSPAAGAIADRQTLQRARSLGLEARKFLESSDAFSFFDKLGETIITGATGTNVRDLRILLAR